MDEGWAGTKDHMTIPTRLIHYSFENELLCDLEPFSIVDSLFSKPYLWDRHDTYRSRPQKVIVKIRNPWYGIPERQPTSMAVMISAKQTKKLINHAQNFTLFMINPQHPRNTVAMIRLIDQRNS